MNRTTDSTENFSLFNHLEYVNEKDAPPDPHLYHHLPWDLPPKEQEIIEQARFIMEERERKRDRTYDQLVALWRPEK